MQVNPNKYRENKIVNFLLSGLPGEGNSGVDKNQIYSTIASDKKIFFKIIPLIMFFLVFIFVIQAVLYFITGADNCIGNNGPFIPSFFCRGDVRPLVSSVSRLLLTFVSFVLVSELLLLIFWFVGLFSKTKFNKTIPKQLMVVFWFIVSGIFLLFVGLMIFG